jgi:hypothetical protein
LKELTQPFIRENAPLLLAAHHRVMLEQGSGISPETINDRGYFTATEPDDLRELGY